MLKIAELFQKAVERRLLTAEAEAGQRLAAVRAPPPGRDSMRWTSWSRPFSRTWRQTARSSASWNSDTRPTTILATNTSSLPGPAIAGRAAHPRAGRRPALLQPRPQDAARRGRAGAGHGRRQQARRSCTGQSALGKTPVLVKDSPGFVVNRILMPYLNEAVLLVAEGMPIDRGRPSRCAGSACRWGRWSCSTRSASTWRPTSPGRCSRRSASASGHQPGLRRCMASRGLARAEERAWASTATSGKKRSSTTEAAVGAA